MQASMINFLSYICHHRDHKSLSGRMPIMTRWQQIMTVLLMLITIGKCHADSINSLTVSADEVAHEFDYTHYRIIGICEWLHYTPLPKTQTTLEVDEYKPDLIVTVYNQLGDDPWIEANTLIDSVANNVGSSLIKQVTGFGLDEGNNSNQPVGMHYDDLRSKIVDVIGTPLSTLPLPFPQLTSDAASFLPYYQSQLDTLGRLGIAEHIRPETYEPVGHYIGQRDTNHWSYEFPRDMNVSVDNDYKASVIVALRAADIVTNHNTLHTVKSTDDSCGDNCAVSNVIEETTDKNEIWQEVYPNDKHIQLGEDDVLSINSLGSKEELNSDGNYVFVIWRHYQGCVQGKGNLIFYSTKIKPTQKR